MGGELAFSGITLEPDRDFVRPSMNSQWFDLIIRDEKGNRIIVVADKDWAYLAMELLQPIREEAKKIFAEINYGIEAAKSEGKVVRMIEIGTNDKRIMDIHYGGVDKCNQINGIPVLVNYNKSNHIGYLVDYEFEMPF